MSAKICCVKAYEVLDSRANPTVAVKVVLSDGSEGFSIVPSGASTGTFEAVELRDGNKKRYGGKGVLQAVKNINDIIAPRLIEQGCIDQFLVDDLLIKLDGTENKAKLGANALLGVSLSVCRAAAEHYKMPLYRYVGGISSYRMPVPMMNILNGGAHASNNIDIQEFMIYPLGAPSFKEAVRAGSEIYHTLADILKADGKSTAVGDEGGFAPELSSDEAAIEYIINAIEKAGYSTNEVKICLDAAASEWQSGEGEYFLPKRAKKMTSKQLVDYWCALVKKYPIFSLEDPLAEEDWISWEGITDKLNNDVQLVGDDLFVTNKNRLKEGFTKKSANAILIKPNQIGTLSETIQVIVMAKQNGYKTVMSHRSGESEDTTIADLAVALNCGQIKTGAPARSERVAKYNRLISIENELYGSQFNKF